MKNFLIILLMIVIGDKLFAGTCSSISRTNYSANEILTSTKLNADLNTVYGAANSLDGGCVTDSTIEKAALINDAANFEALFKGIHNGCYVSYLDPDQVQVGPCQLSVGSNFVSTTANTNSAAITIATANTQYYIYAASASTGTTLTLTSSTTAPASDGYLNGNKVLGSIFVASASSVFATDSNAQWKVNGFSEKVEELWDTSTQSFTNGDILKVTNKIKSTHGSYNSTTGLFTVPKNGVLKVFAGIDNTASANTVSNYILLGLHNGSAYVGYGMNHFVQSTTSMGQAPIMALAYPVTKGQQYSVKILTNLSGTKTLSNGNISWIME